MTSQFTTGFAKQCQKFYINIFYNTSNNKFQHDKYIFNKTSTSTDDFMTENKEINMKNANKEDIPRLLK